MIHIRTIKYLIIGILIICISKNKYISAQSFNLTLSPDVANSSTLSPSMASPIIGSYDPINKTATLKFTNIVEYNRSVTPPNVTNPKMILFGSMPTQSYTKSNNMGGIRSETQLYGIVNSNSNKNSITSTNNQSTNNIDTADNQVVFYDSQSKIAVLINGNVYVAVVEYSQTVTPPNISNPSLQIFATIPNENYIPTTLMGAQGSNTTLYGIPVTGHKKIVKDENDTTIGHYWPDNKIAQLANGQTFVCIIQKNETPQKIGLTLTLNAVGPVYKWFNNEDLKKYNISNQAQNFQDRVQNVGTSMINGQKFTLYGVLLQSKSTTPFSTTQVSMNKIPTLNYPVQSNKQIIQPLRYPITSKRLFQQQANNRQQSISTRQPIQLQANLTPGQKVAAQTGW